MKQTQESKNLIKTKQLEPQTEVNLENLKIFFNAYDKSGKNKLEMDKFKQIFLTNDPNLRQSVSKKRGKGEDFSENTK